VHVTMAVVSTPVSARITVLCVTAMRDINLLPTESHAKVRQSVFEYLYFAITPAKSRTKTKIQQTNIHSTSSNAKKKKKRKRTQLIQLSCDCRTACVNVLVLLRNFIRLISHKDATSCSPRKCLISRITSFSETLKIF